MFVRRILILAARKWRHANGTRYLSEAPLIEPMKGPARKPYPLEWAEQTRLLAELPGHLERMALFDVNTGLRSSELRGLRWSWEVQVPELETSVFILPEEMTKNGNAVRAQTSRRRRQLRGPAGSARASLGPDHDPLLRAGYHAIVGCCELDLRAATGDSFANRSAGCGSIAGKFRQYSGSDASGKKQAPDALTLTR